MTKTAATTRWVRLFGEIDYFRGNRFAGWFLNNWAISSIISLRSGDPFSVTTGTDRNLDGTNNDRANLVGDPRLDPNRSRAEATSMWFNTAAFTLPALGTNGSSGRNVLD